MAGFPSYLVSSPRGRSPVPPSDHRPVPTDQSSPNRHPFLSPDQQPSAFPDLKSHPLSRAGEGFPGEESSLPFLMRRVLEREGRKRALWIKLLRRVRIGELQARAEGMNDLKTSSWTVHKPAAHRRRNSRSHAHSDRNKGGLKQKKETGMRIFGNKKHWKGKEQGNKTKTKRQWRSDKKTAKSDRQKGKTHLNPERLLSMKGARKDTNDRKKGQHDTEKAEERRQGREYLGKRHLAREKDDGKVTSIREKVDTVAKNKQRIVSKPARFGQANETGDGVLDEDLYPFLDRKDAAHFFTQRHTISSQRQWLLKLANMKKQGGKRGSRRDHEVRDGSILKSTGSTGEHEIGIDDLALYNVDSTDSDSEVFDSKSEEYDSELEDYDPFGFVPEYVDPEDGEDSDSKQSDLHNIESADTESEDIDSVDDDAEDIELEVGESEDLESEGSDSENIDFKEALSIDRDSKASDLSSHDELASSTEEERAIGSNDDSAAVADLSSVFSEDSNPAFPLFGKPVSGKPPSHRRHTGTRQRRGKQKLPRHTRRLLLAARRAAGRRRPLARLRSRRQRLQRRLIHAKRKRRLHNPGKAAELYPKGPIPNKKGHRNPALSKKRKPQRNGAWLRRHLSRRWHKGRQVRRPSWLCAKEGTRHAALSSPSPKSTLPYTAQPINPAVVIPPSAPDVRSTRRETETEGRKPFPDDSTTSMATTTAITNISITTNIAPDNGKLEDGEGGNEMSGMVPVKTVYLGTVEGPNIHTRRLDLLAPADNNTQDALPPVYVKVQYKQEQNLKSPIEPAPTRTRRNADNQNSDQIPTDEDVDEDVDSVNNSNDGDVVDSIENDSKVEPANNNNNDTDDSQDRDRRRGGERRLGRRQRQNRGQRRLVGDNGSSSDSGNNSDDDDSSGAVSQSRRRPQRRGRHQTGRRRSQGRKRTRNREGNGNSGNVGFVTLGRGSSNRRRGGNSHHRRRGNSNRRNRQRRPRRQRERRPHHSEEEEHRQQVVALQSMSEDADIRVAHTDTDPVLPQVQSIRNNNNNGNDAEEAEVHIRSPFINHRTAYDFLSTQARSRPRGASTNEQRAEQWQFNHRVSESLCEVFDRHFVPTAIGGRCE